MMTLLDAALVFNGVAFTDKDGLNSFVGQILPFDDNTRSSSTARRRILEVAPSINVPDVVINSVTGEFFMVASHSTDFFMADAIRNKYPIVPSDYEYTINDAEGILNNSGGQQSRGSVSYVRRESVSDMSSNLGGFSVTLPGSVGVSANDYIYHDGDYYRSKEFSYVDDLGLTAVTAIRIENLIQTLDVTVKGAYDPASETNADPLILPYLCIVEPREKAFTNSNQDYEEFEAGDVTIATLADCVVGSLIGNYTVVSEKVSGVVHTYHCRFGDV